MDNIICNIPVRTQLVRSYPIILEMLQLRGYNIDGYKPITVKEVQQTTVTGSNPCGLEPIITNKPPICFTEKSREFKELKQWVKIHSVEVSASFYKQYPTLSKIIMEHTPYEEREKHFTKEGAYIIDKYKELLTLYKELCTPIIEVHFQQCFNIENLWTPNARDGGKFMNDMERIILNLESRASELVNTALEESNFDIYSDKEKESIRKEVVKLFKSNRTLVFLFRTKNKASATLDQKYEKYCSHLLSKHGIVIQLFNLRNLMFNITKHFMVPHHQVLNMWINGEEIEIMKKTYNIHQFSELPIISHNDPVAKFIGLIKGDVCKITRNNKTSGTYIIYRYCR